MLTISNMKFALEADPDLKPVFYYIAHCWRIMNQLESEIKKTCLHR